MAQQESDHFIRHYSILVMNNFWNRSKFGCKQVSQELTFLFKNDLLEILRISWIGIEIIMLILNSCQAV